MTRGLYYWVAFITWSLLAVFLYAAEPIDAVMTVYVLTSFLALLLMHSIEKRRYLKCLEDVEPDKWRALMTSASYKWLGAGSPILLGYVFARHPCAVQRLEEARRSYRHSEILSPLGIVIIAMIYTVLPAPVS